MSQFTSTVLTSKGAVLAYALPLLFISFTLIFAGTYLTFDRTRSFLPLDDPEDSVVLDIPGRDWEQSGGGDQESTPGWEKKLRLESRVPRTNPRFARLLRSSKNRVKWRLEGGVGGLLTGYTLGVYIPTALTLYITQHSSRTMTSAPFLIITYLGAILFSLLGARFHQVALLFGSVGGSFSITTITSFAISLSTLGHLSLWAAVTVLLLIVPTLSFFSANKFLTSLHWSMRVAQSSLGSMGVVFSIAVLANVPGWADALGILWANTHQENGATLALSVMGWLLLVLGVGCDWTLYKTVGPSPDQNWDNYLAHYLDNLPNRAGHFERLPSLWSRIASVFHRRHRPVPNSLDEDSLSSRITKVRESPKRRKTRKGAPAVHFDLASSSSEGSGTDHSSDLTLRDPENPLTKGKEWTIDKYETEADITSNLLFPEDSPTDWKPTFLLKNHDMKTINDDS